MPLHVGQIPSPLHMLQVTGCKKMVYLLMPSPLHLSHLPVPLQRGHGLTSGMAPTVSRWSLDEPRSRGAPR